MFSEDMADEVRDQLLSVQGVLVWVDPVTGRDDRSQLDAVLREAAAAGVWVSAHPDVILKMGTKEVLYRTKELGWGSDTFLYPTKAEFEENFPARLATGEARVLKQYRGNGGIGVWKVQVAAAQPGVTPASVPGLDALIEVQSARARDEAVEEVTLGEFTTRCKKYFSYSGGEGRLIDQPFQPRISEGIIRCYPGQGRGGRPLPPVPHRALARRARSGWCQQRRPAGEGLRSPGSQDHVRAGGADVPTVAPTGPTRMGAGLADPGRY
jgi:hypothetical protein